MRVHSLVELPILHSAYSESGLGVAPGHQNAISVISVVTHLPAKLWLPSVRWPYTSNLSDTMIDVKRRRYIYSSTPNHLPSDPLTRTCCDYQCKSFWWYWQARIYTVFQNWVRILREFYAVSFLLRKVKKIPVCLSILYSLYNLSVCLYIYAESVFTVSLYSLSLCLPKS